MFFCFALAAHSFSGILRGRRSASVLYFLSVAGIVWIRPHLATVVIFSGLVGLYVFRKRRPLPNGLARVWYAASLTIAILGTGTLVVFLSRMSVQAIIASYSGLMTGLAYGGSALDIPQITSIGDLFAQIGRGIIAVLFRPFLWESGSLSSRIEALHALLISAAVLAIVWLMIKHKRMFATAYQAFLVMTCVGFTVIFGALAANLGTTSRERIQLTPFLWLLMAAASTPVLSVSARLREHAGVWRAAILRPR